MKYRCQDCHRPVMRATNTEGVQWIYVTSGSEFRVWVHEHWLKGIYDPPECSAHWILRGPRRSVCKVIPGLQLAEPGEVEET